MANDNETLAHTAGSECAYCGGDHDENRCPIIYTPIRDCSHKDAEDGCCLHPKNMTPECHPDACPRLDQRLFKYLNTPAEARNQ